MFKIAVFSICWFSLNLVLCLDLEHNLRHPTSKQTKVLISANISSECKRDMLEYFKGVQNLNKWALKMVDSMEKFPSGLLWGRKIALGQLNECLEVARPNFTGQYCVMEMAIKPITPNITLKKVPTIGHRSLGQFSYGICVPSSCTPTDLNNVVNGFDTSKFLESKIFEDGCNKQGEIKFRTKDYIVVALFLVLILLAVASTVYEVHYMFFKKKEIKRKVLTTFSLYSNTKYIFQITKNSHSLNVLHGIRFFSFTWVVFGHIYFHLAMFENELRPSLAYEVLNKKDAAPATNSFISVDSFFFLAGVLICFSFFQSISGKGSYDAVVVIIKRYLRLTPPLAALVLFNSTIFSRTIVSPYSKIVFHDIETACQKYWWAYIFHLQNYNYDAARSCFSPAWYLSVDMQMFLFSPLILYVLLLKPKFAPKYLCLLILGTTFASFVSCYNDNLAANRNQDFTLSQKRVSAQNEYVLFYTRMPAWLIGIGTGYIICSIKAKKISFQPKMVWVVVGWLVCAFLCLVSLYGITFFYPYKNMFDYPVITRALYRSLHRVGWALGLSWIVIASSNGYGGPINWLLSFNVYQPLGKLSYCAFLIHVDLQKYRSLNYYRTVRNYNTFDLIYIYIGDVVLSTALAIPMSLLIELPFFNIGRHLLENVNIFPYPKTNLEKFAKK